MQTQPAAVSAGAPNLLLQFAYDGMGRRVQKKVSNWNGSAYVLASDTRFLYDGWNMVAEFSILNSTFNLSRAYVWGLDLSGAMQGAGGVGGLLFSTVNSEPGTVNYAAAYDGNGNIINLTSLADGSDAADFEYDPFGNILKSVGVAANAQPFGFSTKYRDAETGLLYYGERYLNTSTGRFLSRDPLGEQGGKNLYGFVANDAVDHWDYLGLVLSREALIKGLDNINNDINHLKQFIDTLDGDCPCNRLRKKLHILLKDSAELQADLNAEIDNEMSGQWLSTRNLFLTEGLEAGTAAATAYESGVAIAAKNVQPWLGLGGKLMSDYAPVVNRLTIKEAVSGLVGEEFSDKVIDPATKLAILGTASRLSSNFSDASNFGEGTMAIAEQLTDRMELSYILLSDQIKKLQQQYRTNCK